MTEKDLMVALSAFAAMMLIFALLIVAMIVVTTKKVDAQIAERERVKSGKYRGGDD